MNEFELDDNVSDEDFMIHVLNNCLRSMVLF